jgi:phosphoadenosine phosphosulfate reductase
MIEILERDLSQKTITDQLKFLSEKFIGKIAFSTSFGQEDQVITDIIFKHHIPVEIFTLDTGRLFEETYKLWNLTEKKYGKKIRAYFPDKTDVEQMVNAKGIFSFYDSVENRQECCRIRKVDPLKRALENHEMWITGLRAQQSVTRTDLNLFEISDVYKVIKFNPLINWSLEDVLAYIKEHQVPYNELHDKGFISIGCAPCTRAVQPGEDIRAGRWWWESRDKKECGLHVDNQSDIKLTFNKINT